MKRYEVLQKLGSGGMGTVYRAYDRLSGQTVALKRVLRQADDLTRLALAHEFEVVASLRHPHIITVLDYGFEDDPFFTMELLEQPRDIRLVAQDMDTVGKVRLLIQMLQALAYLHRRGIIHRDLKPANVLVDQHGQIKVLDFGLATHHDDSARDAGTLAYMAPETLRGEKATHAVDLYAVGVMAYELFAGRHPFNAASTSQLIMSVLNDYPDLSLLSSSDTVRLSDNPPPTAAVVGDVPTQPLDRMPFEIEAVWTDRPRGEDNPLAQIIGNLLTKSPVQRYQEANAVIRDLCAVMGEPVPAESLESYLQAARFVGRADELADLKSALGRMMEKEPCGSAWLIGGESGVGKSRLMNELGVLALVNGARVVRGQAVQEGGSLYHLWRDLLREIVLGVALDDFDAGVLRELVPDIETLIGRTIPPVPILDGVPGQKRLVSAIMRLIRAYPDPLVFLLEDLHWSDESLEVLKPLVSLVSDLRVMVVGSYRDDERPDLPNQLRGMHVLKLHRLDSSSTAQLVESMLGEPPSEVVELLQRETEGNAFFLVEVVRALAEEAGNLSQIMHMTLPTRILTGGIQAIVQRRLDRVPTAAQSLLRLAAVLGRALDVAVLKTVETALDDWLLTCANAAVVEVHEERWRFAHDKLRDGVLSRLTEEERRSLHEKAATALEAVYGEVADQAVVIAQHWQAAGNPAKELHYTRIAAKQFQANSVFRNARTLYERALELTTDEIPQIDLYYALGEVQRAMSAYADAVQSLEACQHLAKRHGDRISEANVWLSLGDLARFQGRYDDAEQMQQQALNLAREIGFRPTEGRALGNLAVLAQLRGESEKALAYNLLSLPFLEEADDLRNQAFVIGNIAVINQHLGNYAESLTYYHQAVRLSHQIGDRSVEGNILGNMGALYANMGKMADSLAAQEQAIRIHEEIGDVRRLGYAAVNLGEVYNTIGQVEPARLYLERALKAARLVGDRRLEAYALMNLGSIETLLQTGDYGCGLLSEGIEITQAIKDRGAEAVGLCGLGAAYFQQGQVAQAIETLTRAMTTAQEVSFFEIEQLSRARLAQAYLHQGDLQAMAGLLANLPEKLEPMHAPTLLLLHGILHARMGEADLAIDQWRKALVAADSLLKDTPDLPQPHYTRAVVLAGLGLLVDGEYFQQAQAALREGQTRLAAVGMVQATRRLLHELASLDSGGRLAQIG